MAPALTPPRNPAFPEPLYSFQTFVPVATPAQHSQSNEPLPRPFLKLFRAAHYEISRQNRLSPIDLSFRYRGLVVECIELLDASKNRAQKEVLGAVNMALTVWHLIEILFIMDRTQVDEHVSVHLLEWYRANFPQQRPNLEAISNSSTLSNEEVWNLIAKCVLCGNFEASKKIIAAALQNSGEIEREWKSHSVQTDSAEKRRNAIASRAALKTLQSILLQAPSNTIQSRRDQTWNNWQAVCRGWTTSDELADHHAARQVVQVLSGNHNAIAALCSTWEEMFVACAMYLPEEIGFENALRGGLRTVISASAEASMVKVVPKEGVGLALVEASMGNCFNALVIMEITLPTAWFSAHLGELLVHIGKVSETQPSTEENTNIGAKERFLIKFADELENYTGFWRIAADYYMACPTLGDQRLIDLLMRKEFEGSSDREVEKALHLCEIRNLPKTARRIRNTLGSQCLEYNNLGGAISWYATAGAIREAQKVADLALRAAEREGPDSNGGLLLVNVVNAINKFAGEQLRRNFGYLLVYKDMQEQLKILAGMKAAQEGDDRYIETQSDALLPAVSSFVKNVNTLLVGGGLPRRYWCVVVFEAVRVLEEFPEASQCFSRSALRNLINGLELCSGPHAPDVLLEGIRSRLKWERNAMNAAGMEITDSVNVEDLADSLSYCRTRLSSLLVRAINQS